MVVAAIVPLSVKELLVSAPDTPSDAEWKVSSSDFVDMIDKYPFYLLSEIFSWLGSYIELQEVEMTRSKGMVTRH